jgi:hypothetical protein
MTDEEVEVAIRDHYENEAQTLTTGAEANLLKFRELEGILTAEESDRWEDIKGKFNRNMLMGGRGEDDPVSRVVGTLAGFSEGLGKIENIIAKTAANYEKPATLADVTVEKLERIIANLRAVPVEVEIKVVPVHEGDEPAPAKKAASAAKKKTAAKKKSAATEKKSWPPRKVIVRGEENGLPVDVESTVQQKEDRPPS